MARISTYTEVAPHADDLILGSDMGSLKATKNFKVSSIVALCPQGTVTSVALTAPAAFSVAGSPITSAGTIAITGAGSTAQFIDGTGALQNISSIVGNQTLAQTIAVGNTTSGTDISVSAGDDLLMTDTSKIIMDSDFKIYKGIDNHSHIEETGAGDLMLKSNNEVEIASGIMGEHFARFTKDAGVQLFHDNVKKFETTSNNIKVVGVAAHADNSAALAAGLTAGELYRTGDILKIVH
jgi:hypothetical protein